MLCRKNLVTVLLNVAIIFVSHTFPVCANKTQQAQDASLTALERAVRVHPDDCSAKIALANRCIQLGLLPHALELLNAALEQCPEIGRAYLLRAMAESQAPQQLQLACTDARKAVLLLPKDAQAHKVLANALLMSNDKTDALHEIDRSLSLAPDDVESQKLHVMILQALRRPEAVFVLAQALKKHPDDPGFQYLKARSLPRCAASSRQTVQLLTRAIAKAPSADMFLLRANAYLCEHQQKQCLEDLAQAVSLDSSSIRSVMKMPVSFRCSRGRALADKWVADSHAARNASFVACARRLRGKIREADENYAGAISDYKEALKVDNKPDSTIFESLAGCLLANGQFDECQQVCRKGLRTVGPTKRLRLLLADCCQRKDDFVGAIEQYDKLLASDPRNTKLLEKRLFAHIHAKRTQDACADLETLIVLVPNRQPEFLLVEARVLEKSGDLSSALRKYNQLVAKFPSPEIYRSRGDLYRQLGLKERAKEDYSKAHQITLREKLQPGSQSP